MKIIAADDEQDALGTLTKAIQDAVPDADLSCFTNAVDAVKYAKTQTVDVAFLDIRMPDMDGLSLAENLMKTNPRVNLIFVTGYRDYASDALDLHASGYIDKPATAGAIRFEMEVLRFKPEPNPPRVKIQCFGNFGVFVDGEPLLFTRAKPKELLAYLIHSEGAFISASQIAAILWEDKEYNDSLRSLVRTVIHRLLAVLKEAGAEDIIIKKWNGTAIDKEKISCDYYQYLHDKKQYADIYRGEYLPEYSWAESTQAFLNNKTK
ncbi:response regulator [Ruminococcaceae bacterium OttesenSCG-928-I18]|nr:response regulator [Ruminococcaceae bacterium OttesenSCG-928-I18]